MARQRFERCDLAHVQVALRRPVLALDAAFNKLRQPGDHARARIGGDGKRRVEARRFLRGREQSGRQDVAAAPLIARARREVIGQAIGIQIGRQLRGGLLPQLFVAQADGDAGLLLQARIRVARKPVAHAGQAIGQLGLQRQAHAAAAGQGVGGGRHVLRQGAIQLHQRGLLHRDRHGGQHALAHLQRIARAAGLVLGFDLPQQRFWAQRRQLRRRGDLPGDFARLAGGHVDGLRVEREQRGARRQLHLHRRLGGVAHGDERAEGVAPAHQRRQAADDLQILRGGDAGAAGAEQAGAAVGDGDDAKAGERVVQRYVDARAALGIELQFGLPQQQRVEQLARGRAAAVTARRHRLAAVVAAADDFHLRGGRLHAPSAAVQHGFEQVPAAVGQQFQQCLVDGGDGDFGARGGLAIGQLAFDADARRAAHRVAGLVGLHRDVDAVRLGADADLGHAQPERGLAQIDQRRRRDVVLAVVPEGVPPLARALVAPGEEAVPRHFAQPPAQCQHADVDVGRPVVGHFERNRRIVAAQLDHLRLDHAFALDGDQRRGMAEGHAHLKARGVAGGVLLFLGQQIHAVVVLAAKPDFALARHPHAAGGQGALALAVARADHQFDFARLRHLDVAHQQAARVAGAGADRAQVLGFGAVVVGVKAAHHALAAGGGDAGDGLDIERHAGLGLAVQIQRQRLQLGRLAGRDPAFGADAGNHARRPQRRGAAQGLDLAVGVGKVGLDHQLARAGGGLELVDGHAALALPVERDGQLVGHHALVLAGGAFFFAVFARLRPFGARARRLKAELVIAVKAQ